MKISIITVCLNSADTVTDTLESVLSQTHRPLEYLIVDGVSTDGTLHIIEEYRSKFASADIDFSVISEKDKGIYDAMNKGIQSVSGEVVGIINSDDLYFSGDVLECVRDSFLSDQKPGLVYGIMSQIDGSGLETSAYRTNYDYYLLDYRRGSGGGQHPTVFVKKSLYERIGLFDIGIGLAADYDFLIRAKKSGAKFLAVNKIITKFRLTGATGSLSPISYLKYVQKVQLKNQLISPTQAKKDLLYTLMMERVFKFFARKIAKNFYWLLK